jgi:uncharacterized RmlC-like cupin family protein
MSSRPNPGCKVIHADTNWQGTESAGYSAGISKETIEAHGIAMAIFELAPGAIDTPVHIHDHETAAYVLSGRIGLFHGAELETYEEAGPGDFIYVAENAPHLVLNVSQTDTARVVVARTDPRIAGSAIPIPELEAARIEGRLARR